MRSLSHRIQISDPALFWRKIVRLLATTLVIAPLVTLKLYLPTLLYVGVLLLLHTYILYIYLNRVDWRHLAASRSGLIARVLGVIFFAYILTLVKFTGQVQLVLFNVGLAVMVHVLILALLMIKVEKAFET